MDLKTAFTVLFLINMLGAAAWSTELPDRAGDPPVVQLRDEPVPDDGPKLSAHGVILGADGKEVAGATVFLQIVNSGSTVSVGELWDRDILGRTESDAQGRFAFEQVPIPLRMPHAISSLICGRGGAQVLVVNPGSAVAWASVMHMKEEQPLRLVLSPEANVRVSVQDEAGRGIPHAAVEIHGFSELTETFESRYRGPGGLRLSRSEFNPLRHTDEAGQVVLKHLPVDRLVFVRIEAPAHERQLIAIDTSRDAAESKQTVVETYPNQPPIPLCTSPCTVTLKPAHFVTIRVLDASGEPVHGGWIEMTELKGPYAQYGPVDASGRAALRIISAGRVRYIYRSDRSQPAMGSSIELEVTADQDQQAEIRLPETRWLTGRVVSADTGAGVVGANVEAQPEFPTGRAGDSVATRSLKGGEFRIPVNPGHVRLQVQQPLYGFFVDHFAGPDLYLEIPKDGEIEPVVLNLSPGLVVNGLVVNAQGNPLPNVPVHAEQQVGRRQVSLETVTDREGRFRLAGLSPQAETVIRASVGATGDCWLLKAQYGVRDDSIRHETIQLRLKPGVQLTGRVLKNQQPVPRAVVRLLRSIPGHQHEFFEYAETRTDEQGEYRLGGLAPGDTYRIVLHARDGAWASEWTSSHPYEGQIPTKATEVGRLPDAHLRNYSQILSGTVVDLEGKPVPGASVSARELTLSPRRAPSSVFERSTETDAQGRFNIRQLADAQFELMVCKVPQRGGPAHYLVRMQPKRNASDIRVVIDPNP